MKRTHTDFNRYDLPPTHDARLESESFCGERAARVSDHRPFGHIEKEIIMIQKLTLVAMTLFMALPALASDGAAGGSMALGIMMGVAVLGGALGQGKAAAAAFEAIARNPKADIFVPFILGLALIESLVIYALVVAFVKF